MFNVQKAIYSSVSDYRKLTSQLSKEIFERSFEIGNLTQLAMDFCFDIFVSFGTLFLSIAIFKQKKLSRWLAIVGMLVSTVGLYLNLSTFPEPPADLKLPDPGPFFGFFFGLLILNMIYIIIKSKYNGTSWI
ncbi:hypothetical protein [Flagellimonas maritima]|nr:hypothetical protein [Allomuricauda aurantiaca]